MKQFVLTVDIPRNPRDSVYVAQMLREAAATLEYQVPLQEHLHVYDRYGVQKYEWDTEKVDVDVPVVRKRDRR
jgi:hypothetical protein